MHHMDPVLLSSAFLNARQSLLSEVYTVSLLSMLFFCSIVLLPARKRIRKIFPRVGNVWSPKTFMSMIYSRVTLFVFLSHLICLLDSYSSNYVTDGKICHIYHQSYKKTKFYETHITFKMGGNLCVKGVKTL